MAGIALNRSVNQPSTPSYANNNRNYTNTFSEKKIARPSSPASPLVGGTNSGSYGGGAGGGGMPDMQGMMQQYMGMANQMANFRAQQDERQMGIAYNYRTQEANRDAANQMRLQNQQLQSQERQSGRQLASQERM